jgi:hypothetical protein
MNGKHELLVLGKYFNSQINKNAENMFELGLSDALISNDLIRSTYDIILSVSYLN